MYIGAAYYPELWEEDEIEKDIERCKQLGVNCLRVGEFAWGKMEPSEGTYLKTKYGCIEDLNRKWGMSRWSLDYSTFEEVLPPTPDQWRHPSLRTEWRVFQCEQIYSYINEQAEILHCYTDKPIGTDMMPNNTLSYYRANEQLDVIQFNHYDTAERLPLLAFDYNFLRPIKSHPFWVTETQVSLLRRCVLAQSEQR